jgi:hypothetical protein
MLVAVLTLSIISPQMPPLPAFSTKCVSTGMTSPHQAGVMISDVTYSGGRISVSAYTIAYVPETKQGARELLYIRLDSNPGLFTTLAPVRGPYGAFDLVFDHLAKGWHHLEMAVVTDQYGTKAASFTQLCFPIDVGEKQSPE